MARALPIQRRVAGPDAVEISRPHRSASPDAAPVLVVPHEGAEHPVFVRPLGVDDVLVIGIELPRTPVRTALVDIRGALNAAAQWARDAGETPLVHEEASRRAVCLYITQVERPAVVLRAYVRALREIPGAVACVALHRYIGVPGQVSRNLVTDPRAPAQPASPEDVGSPLWWDSSFGPAAVAPASEPPRGLFSMIPVAGAFLSERRLTAVHFPDVRVVYGAPDAHPAANDAMRAGQVAAILRAELHASFGGRPPVLLADHESGIDNVVHQGRAGYCFRVRQHAAPMTAFYAASFRHREQELMIGLRGAVLALGLERTIHWERGGGVYRVCVWERLSC